MPDSLSVLRGYAELAPMNLRVLVSLSAAVLDQSTVRPLSSAVTQRPTERTVRYYVASKLMSPPDGKGPAASYTYRHLLQLLFIKLRQMDGGTLTAIREELDRESGDVLERRVASALGERLPPPADLEWRHPGGSPGGRAGRALEERLSAAEPAPKREPARSPETWTRIPVEKGAELHLSEDHPALGDRTLRHRAVEILKELFSSAWS